VRTRHNIRKCRDECTSHLGPVQDMAGRGGTERRTNRTTVVIARAESAFALVAGCLGDCHRAAPHGGSMRAGPRPGWLVPPGLPLCPLTQRHLMTLNSADRPSAAPTPPVTALARADDDCLPPAAGPALTPCRNRCGWARIAQPRTKSLPVPAGDGRLSCPHSVALIRSQHQSTVVIHDEPTRRPKTPFDPQSSVSDPCGEAAAHHRLR
jgi:hypothetical protein